MEARKTLTAKIMEFLALFRCDSRGETTELLRDYLRDEIGRFVEL
jgi:hypothetical protein